MHTNEISIKKDAIKGWLNSYLNKRMLAILLLGFSSGLPVSLVGGTLQAWFATSGSGVVQLGYMTLITQPYSYKFLWAPLLDKYHILKLLDQRRDWILAMQLCLIGIIALMSWFDPYMKVTIYNVKIPVLFILGFFLSIFSATQDIAVDTYRTIILKADERGLGTALSIEGYRLAMIVSGGFSLIIAEHFGWRATYLFMSGLMSIGLLATLIAPKIATYEKVSTGNLFSMLNASLKNFFNREKAAHLLLLIILYKLSDVFAHALSTKFLIDLQFSLTEIATINKILGVIATLIGVLLGGIIMTRVKLFHALLFFGVLASVSNLTYMLLAIFGKNYVIACLVIFIENICAGLGTAALVSLIMSLCSVGFVATQFALLSSLASLGRIYVGPISGYLVTYMGWAYFYLFSALIAIPALLLLLYLKPYIDRA